MESESSLFEYLLVTSVTVGEEMKTSIESKSVCRLLKDQKTKRKSWFCLSGASVEESFHLDDMSVFSENLIARYPEVDSAEYPLQPGLALFACPEGVKQQLPAYGPRFSSAFSLTDADGKVLYGYSLVQYTQLTKDNFIANACPALRRFYFPQCVCVLSRHPYHRTFLCFIRHLSEILPEASFDAGTLSHVRSLLNTSVNPPRRRLSVDVPPAVDVDFAPLFKHLSRENVLLIFEVLLNEGQLLFVSSCHVRRFMVIQAVLILLYPFQWPYPLIPYLPGPLAGIVQAPTPYIFGLDRRSLAVVELPDESVLIDVDANLVLPASHFQRMLTEDHIADASYAPTEEELANVMPSGLQRLPQRLKDKLRFAINKYANLFAYHHLTSHSATQSDMHSYAQKALNALNLSDSNESFSSSSDDGEWRQRSAKPVDLRLLYIPILAAIQETSLSECHTSAIVYDDADTRPPAPPTLQDQHTDSFLREAGGASGGGESKHKQPHDDGDEHTSVPGGASVSERNLEHQQPHDGGEQHTHAPLGVDVSEQKLLDQLAFVPMEEVPATVATTEIQIELPSSEPPPLTHTVSCEIPIETLVLVRGGSEVGIGEDLSCESAREGAGLAAEVGIGEDLSCESAREGAGLAATTSLPSGLLSPREREDSGGGDRVLIPSSAIETFPTRASKGASSFRTNSNWRHTLNDNAKARIRVLPTEFVLPDHTVQLPSCRNSELAFAFAVTVTRMAEKRAALNPCSDNSPHLSAYAVTKSFALFFVDLLRTYRGFLLEPDKTDSLEPVFNSEAFLESNLEYRTFLRMFLDTQMFQVFTQERFANPQRDYFDTIVQQQLARKRAQRSSLGKVDFQGYLYKEKSPFSRVFRAWFVLEGRLIRAVSEPGARRPVMRELELASDSTVVALREPTEFQRNHPSITHYFGFLIRCAKRELYLYAESAEERRAWLRHISARLSGGGVDIGDDV